jgi:hypothetical protein
MAHPTSSLPLSLTLLLAVALLAPAPPARANCGAEGCPISARGPESSGGRFSVHLRWQEIDQDRHWDGDHEVSAADALRLEGGLGHVLEQSTHTRLATLDADARLARRLSLALSLPWVDRTHRHALAHHAGFFIPAEWHMRGPGDATALANWDLLAPDGAQPTAVTVQFGIKLPTGRTAVDAVDGETPEASARPGSGSTDLLAGVQWRRVVRVPAFAAATTVPLTVGVSRRWNGKGTESYRMGDEWNASLGASCALGSAVRVLAQVSAARHGRDDAGDTDAEPHDTGSTAVYLSPGAQVRLPGGMSAYGYWQAPLLLRTNGPQLVSAHRLNFGLTYALR